jgi:hypothetical protein
MCKLIDRRTFQGLNSFSVAIAFGGKHYYLKIPITESKNDKKQTNQIMNPNNNPLVLNLTTS